MRLYDVARAVIMDTVVPGVAPWDQVLANPYVWHFGLHSIPALPELLVQGKQRQYFDYFWRSSFALSGAVIDPMFEEVRQVLRL